MGKVETEITLSNAKDDVRVQAGMLKEIRQVTVTAVVDTGASTMIITEELRQRLGLEIKDKRRVHLANGTDADCGRTEPVNIRWKDRECSCGAVVIPGAKTVLLGAIPLEDMDLIINPLKQEVIGAHCDVVEALALATLWL